MRMRRALTVLALAGLAALLWAIWDGAAVTAWMEEAAPLPYFAAMALLTAVGVPITPFFVVAGATFGVRLGLVGSGIALAASLSLSYWIARGRVRRWLESLLHRYGRELPRFGEAGRNAVRFTLMVKLTPGVPAFVKTYGLAAAGVPFAPYLGVSMLVTGTYAAALVLLGESLLDHDLGRALLPVAVIVLLGAVLLLVRRRRQSSAGGRRGWPAVHGDEQRRPSDS